MKGKLLDLLCHGEKTTATSPSGNVECFVCHGWCEAWGIKSHGYFVEGWRFKQRGQIITGMEILATQLRRDLRLEAAAEIDRLRLRFEEEA